MVSTRLVKRADEMRDDRMVWSLAALWSWLHLVQLLDILLSIVQHLILSKSPIKRVPRPIVIVIPVLTKPKRQCRPAKRRRARADSVSIYDTSDVAVVVTQNILEV